MNATSSTTANATSNADSRANGMAVAAPGKSLPAEGMASPVVFRGTGRGLEIRADADLPVDALLDGIESELARRPAFFEGSAVTLRIGRGDLPAGLIGRIERLLNRFGLRIAELRPANAPDDDRSTKAPAPAEPAKIDRDAVAGSPSPLASALPAASLSSVMSEDGARIVAGPIRSGVLLEVAGNVIVMGDVNPGAEVRADGNIIVLGALRGLAHAASGGGSGYIIALRFEAQQLRIGTLIARAGEANKPGFAAEIAHANEGRIVVESYQGKLPGGLSTPKR